MGRVTEKYWKMPFLRWNNSSINKIGHSYTMEHQPTQTRKQTTGLRPTCRALSSQDHRVNGQQITRFKLDREFIRYYVCESDRAKSSYQPSITQKKAQENMGRDYRRNIAELRAQYASKTTRLDPDQRRCAQKIKVK